jgi:hypothetical protein
MGIVFVLLLKMPYYYIMSTYKSPKAILRFLPYQLLINLVMVELYFVADNLPLGGRVNKLQRQSRWSVDGLLLSWRRVPFGCCAPL